MRPVPSGEVEQAAKTAEAQTSGFGVHSLMLLSFSDLRKIFAAYFGNCDQLGRTGPFFNGVGGPPNPKP